MDQPVTKKKTTVSANASVPLTDILYRTLHYWPWVLLSLFVCVSIGYIYLLRTPNVYTSTASILIKEDRKGKSVRADEFADIGLFQSKTNIQNEIITLKSSSLMSEVVKRLKLDVNYYKDGTFHKNVAYGYDLPVTVDFVNFPENGSASFRLKVKPDGKYTISGIKDARGESIEKPYTAQIGDTVSTPIGELVVTRTPYCPDSASVDLEVVKIPMVAAAGSYRGRLAVALGAEEGSVINLSISDQSTQRGEDVLGMLIAVYNENWIHDKNQIAVSTSNFITDRLGVIEHELGNVDSDISSYKSEHLIPDVRIASSLYLNESQQTSQELLALNNQLQMTRYIRNWLTSESNNNQVLPTNSGVENVNIQSQLADYNDKILQRNNLVSKSSDKNPLVVAIDEQIAALRGAIIQSVDNSIIALQTQIKSLQSAQAATTSKIASNPSQAKYLLSVERQQKVKESLYLFLLQKREENELNQAFTAYNTRIVEHPSSSGIPTYPNRRNVLMMSFLIGLAIPFGFIYVKETSNTKLRGRKDVEDLITPFLGEIPLYGKSDSSEQKQFVVRSGSRDIINESFRVLRTNVEFMRVNRDSANVVAITSFNPGSGKSFLTMNLAASLAIKNRKVLVIDGDMRHGSSSQYVNSPAHGLADYLAGSVDDVNRVIVTVEDMPNLQVLPIGVIPPNPTELLETPQFASMLEKLRGNYDYILIDCPPIEVVADAQIIDNLVDRTIFVLRAGMLERSMLPELDRLYNEKKYRNMAFILNGTRNDQGRYGYSHSYRYGYGYGYGYGYNYGQNDNKSNKKKK